MRQTIREIEVNVAYRWFLGYSLTEKIPHFSTFNKNYESRFKNTDICKNYLEEADHLRHKPYVKKFIVNIKKQLNEYLQMQKKNESRFKNTDICKNYLEEADHLRHKPYVKKFIVNIKKQLNEYLQMQKKNIVLDIQN